MTDMTNEECIASFGMTKDEIDLMNEAMSDPLVWEWFYGISDDEFEQMFRDAQERYDNEHKEAQP